MADEAIKKRMARAKTKAAADLRSFGYSIVPGDNMPICLVGLRSSGEVRVIKICIDSIGPADRQAIQNYPSSEKIIREIWLRRTGDERFEIHKI